MSRLHPGIHHLGPFIREGWVNFVQIALKDILEALSPCSRPLFLYFMSSLARSVYLVEYHGIFRWYLARQSKARATFTDIVHFAQKIYQVNWV